MLIINNVCEEAETQNNVFSFSSEFQPGFDLQRRPIKIGSFSCLHFFQTGIDPEISRRNIHRQLFRLPLAVACLKIAEKDPFFSV